MGCGAYEDQPQMSKNNKNGWVVAKVGEQRKKNVYDKQRVVSDPLWTDPPEELIRARMADPVPGKRRRFGRAQRKS